MSTKKEPDTKMGVGSHENVSVHLDSSNTVEYYECEDCGFRGDEEELRSELCPLSIT